MYQVIITHADEPLKNSNRILSRSEMLTEFPWMASLPGDYQRTFFEVVDSVAWTEDLVHVSITKEKQ